MNFKLNDLYRALFYMYILERTFACPSAVNIPLIAVSHIVILRSEVSNVFHSSCLLFTADQELRSFQFFCSCFYARASKTTLIDAVNTPLYVYIFKDRDVGIELFLKLLSFSSQKLNILIHESRTTGSNQ